MGLTRLGNYFAISTTYERQSRLLASYIRHVLDVNDAERVALVASDIPAYDGSVEAFTKAFPGVAVYRPSKNENGSSMAANLCLGPTKNYDVVYPLTTPVYYLQMAKAADCGPRYAGVGITMGLDVVASIGCPETRGARFFSPFPAWEDRDRFDPSFDHAVRAARKRQPGFTSDDIVWLLWGASKDVGSLLLEAGKTLTRKRFIATTERATVRTGVWPRLRFAPKDHFGANQVSVLRNACKPRGDADGYYVTQQAFKKSF